MYLKLRNFMKTVTTAGTREALTTSNIRCPALMLQAEASNTGSVYVGDSAVSSSLYAVDLNPGDVVSLTAADFGMAGADISLKDIWLDVGTSTDGVAVSYVLREDE